MTLRARIRIAPSRLLAAAGAFAAAGALVLPLAVLCAWIEPSWLASVVGAALLGAALPGSRLYRQAMAGHAIEVSISEEGRVELLGSETGETRDETLIPSRKLYRLGRGSLAWPWLTVLVLEPVDRHEAGLPRRSAVRIAVLRRDLDAEDARCLHRFVLWSLRGGAAVGSGTEATGRPASI